jgi:hypothetical protein
MWTEVSLKYRHEDGSTTTMFDKESMLKFDKEKDERSQGEVLQLHEMLIKVYLGWV